MNPKSTYPKSMNPLFWIGLIGLFTVGSSFFVDLHRAFYSDKGIYWTHASMKLPIEKTEDDLEVFIGGKLLQHHLSQKTLYATDRNGTHYPVVSEDIRIRLNNWYRVKSTILATTTLTGFAFGITLTLLTIGLIQIFLQKKKNGSQRAGLDSHPAASPYRQ